MNSAYDLYGVTVSSSFQYLVQTRPNGYFYDGRGNVLAIGAGAPTASAGMTGAQGPEGPQGVQGVEGATGPQGEMGLQGPIGNTGATGSQGPQGNQGFTGISGNTGAQGNTGAVGAQGSQGRIGATGSQGVQGPQGNQGNTGATGLQGPQGNQGVIGVTGSQGNTGATGLQGPQGNQGVQGTQGVQGFQGNIGATGSQGNTGTGVQGPIGLQGPAGSGGSGGGSTFSAYGTINRLIKFTGATQGGDSNFYDDGSYQSVGGAPVSGVGFRIGLGSAEGFEFLPGFAGYNFVQSYNRTTLSYVQLRTSALSYLLQTSGTDRLTISATGSVTISDLAGSGVRMVVADASGNLNTQTIPTGGGGSSLSGLTAGYIVKAISATAVSISNIYETSGGTVSIGVTNSTVGYKLDVAGDIAFAQTLNVRTTTDLLFKINGSNAGRIGSGTTYQTALGLGSLNNNSGNANTAVGYNTMNASGAGSQNVAVGASALISLTNGSNNVAMGVAAGYTLTTQAQNVFIGYYSGLQNSGSDNTFIGAETGTYMNTSASYNTLLGYQAGGDSGNYLSSGNYCLALGYKAQLPNNTSDGQLSIMNTIFGVGMTAGGNWTTPGGRIGILTKSPTVGYALDVAGDIAFAGKFFVRTTTNFELNINGTRAGYMNLGALNTYYGYGSGNAGTYNTAIGHNAMSNTSGVGSAAVAVGYAALSSLTSGDYNVAFGYQAGLAITTGSYNVAFGSRTLLANTSGTNNIAIGGNSLLSNTTGTSNIAIGTGAVQTANANGNVGIGSNSLNVAAGSFNVALGHQAAQSLTGGANIAIGANQELASNSGSNQMNIGGAIFGISMNGSVSSPAGQIGILTNAPTAGFALDVNGKTKTVMINSGSGNTFNGSNNHIVGEALTITSGASYVSMLGGYSNTMTSTGYISGIVGGSGNSNGGTNCWIFGNGGNIQGGTNNHIFGGGAHLIFGTTASGNNILGGYNNAIDSGKNSNNLIGTYIYAQKNGCVMLKDNLSAGYFYADRDNQFAAAFGGGYRFNLAYNVKALEIKTNGIINYITPVYADNTAALAAGLTAGDQYKTSTGIRMETY